ncbi:hypothetical protein [Absidia glauca]|uniref:FAS1 domain-containing protein n=1 Tax=Absidia glauca TaxID=4829 RepID=A0A168QSL7_ABSGL|nr:hypothetical protein [Absidia glauca]
MLLKQGLLLLLSVAAVKSQVDDCSSTSNNGTVSAGKQNDAGSPFSCPLLNSASNSSTTSGNNSTTNGTGMANKNETIFQFLNSTDSPVPKFTQLINSSPDFKPLIDILSNPDNHTLFLPCDEALEQLLSLTNATSGGSNGTSSNSTSSNNTTSGGTGGQNQSSSIVGHHAEAWTLHNLADKDKNDTSSGNGGQSGSGGGDDESSGGGKQNSTQAISQGLSNFSIVDVLSYHILNGSWPLTNITHGIHINDTLMSNETAYPLAEFAPLVIINNSTSMNGTNSTSGGQNSTSSGQNSTSSGDNSTSTENGSNSAISFLSLLAQNATDQNSTSHGNSSSSSNVTVGNGIGYANIIMPDITLNNGIVHIIDKILVPPVSLVDALKQLNETQVTKHLNETSGSSSNSSSSSNSTETSSPDNSTAPESSPSEIQTGNTFVELSSLMDASDNKSAELTSLLNSATNVTIFLPSDQAIKNFTSNEEKGSKNDSSMNMTDLVKNHVVNGTYYTSNFTETPLNATTLNGTQIELTGSANGTMFQVGNATIVKANILTNQGVVHVIDQVLQPSAPSSNSSNSSTPSESSSSSTQEAQPTETASSAAGLHLMPSLASGVVCFCLGLLSLM